MEEYYTKRCSEIEDPVELTEYMLQTAPYIQELLNLKEENVSDAKFPLAFKKNTKQKELFERFLVEVEGKYPDEIKTDRSFEIYKRCDVALIDHSSASSLVCPKCGLTVDYLGEELSYKEEQEIEKNFVYSYKRENHFNEWISQFQGIESTTIPTEIIDQLRYEFQKQRIKKLEDITHPKVRNVLKKLRLNKYYEHVPYITTILNGITPPRMSHALEAKLRLMFAEIQQPFEKHCPTERKNFLSYSYVLYKFCELLGEDDFLPCFPLLKSKEKLKQQDKIWKNITIELKWEYIPTI